MEKLFQGMLDKDHLLWKLRCNRFCYQTFSYLDLWPLAATQILHFISKDNCLFSPQMKARKENSQWIRCPLGNLGKQLGMLQWWNWIAKNKILWIRSLFSNKVITSYWCLFQPPQEPWKLNYTVKQYFQKWS